MKLFMNILNKWLRSDHLSKNIAEANTKKEKHTHFASAKGLAIANYPDDFRVGGKRKVYSTHHQLRT